MVDRVPGRKKNGQRFPCTTDFLPGDPGPSLSFSQTKAGRPRHAMGQRGMPEEEEEKSVCLPLRRRRRSS
jgi:hypothetical protein